MSRWRGVQDVCAHPYRQSTVHCALSMVCTHGDHGKRSNIRGEVRGASGFQIAREQA